MGKKENGHVIGFDLGGTKMLSVVFDQDFKPKGRERKKTKGTEGADNGVARIIKAIRSSLDEAKVDAASLEAIGVGCPGPLDLDKGIVLEAPNLGWKNLKLKKILEDEFKCPVTIVNDVDAGTFGEYRFGAGKGGRCVLGVFPGTGIGGACIYDGKLLRGKTGSCMEIGHLQVEPDGRWCGCGRRGCLETVASRLAISADAAMAAYRGEAPNLLADAGTDLSNIRSGALSKAVAAGDSIVEAILRTAAGKLGIAVGNVVNLLAPDIVVLGGGLVEAMPDLFVDEVTRHAKQCAMKSFSDSLTVKAATLGDDAAVLGAAALAVQSLGEG